MNSALDVWQERFHQHFTHLHTQKGDSPLFALEHGLNALERDRLAEDVRAHIIDRSPSRLHLLAWIVYAAEIGYGFSGDEFWQTFEQETPAWTFRGDRGWLRDCFRRFAEKYGGAAPSGPWAGHFTIICWPITHAILPRDLQRHLARILYELRFSFSETLLRSVVFQP